MDAVFVVQKFWSVKIWKPFTDSIESSEREDSCWKPPRDNALKINIDCAFDGPAGGAAISMVVWDQNEWMLDGVAKRCCANSVFMAEALGIEEAMKYAIENELDEVMFESDNRELVTHINKMFCCC